MIETGVRTVMITTRAVPAPALTAACRRSSASTHRDFADPLVSLLSLSIAGSILLGLMCFMLVARRRPVGPARE
jgi:hypothetical protein